ncbi:CD225/dispanin family protein [Actinomadura sp. WMMA1423]|uniref:CD225/dispanin family protein n=1 Tax=Actinomadura sp. WMMA1423 TaxID=2591108 RepID=UPI001146ED60|nr:CD225/dispanin family protein [Actinomadura sp. WMMA1423]
MAYPPAPPPPPQSSPGTPPPNHLPWAIATTILCCLPAGVVSIVFAAQVNSKWQAGDHAGALKSSKNAKTWAIVSAVLGLIVGVIYGVLAAVGANSS